MKKLTYLLMIVAAVYSLQGCNSAPKDAEEAADSLNQTKDTTSNAMATGGIAVTSEDAKFATDAADHGMAEVALSEMALQKTTNPQIKEFATMMVKDHGMANKELMSIATTKNITLPSTVDTEHQKKSDQISKMTGKDFDKGYVEAMIDGHEKTLNLLQSQAKDGKDAELKAFAGKTAPTVQMHLTAINKINDSMK